MFSEIQAHIISIVILGIIGMSMFRSKSSRYFLGIVFYFLLITNFLIVLFDMISIIGSYQNNQYSHQMVLISTMLLYISISVLMQLWIVYVDFHIFQDFKRMKILCLVVGPFLILNLVLTLLSPFGDIYFSIDENNQYVRGSLFFIVAAIGFIIFIMISIHILLQRHRLKYVDFWSLFLFPLLPLVAALLRIYDHSVSLIWPSLSMSLLVIYISIQSKNTATDALTGVFNRREYEYQIQLKSKMSHKTYGGIMIDVNDLKIINDQYLHHSGDIALVKLAEILKSCVRKEDFIARIGGDEFVIIFDAEDEDHLKHIIKRIKTSIDAFNQEKKHPFELSISVGYGIFDKKKFTDFKMFIQELDKRMYVAKNEHKYQ